MNDNMICRLEKLIEKNTIILDELTKRKQKHIENIEKQSEIIIMLIDDINAKSTENIPTYLKREKLKESWEELTKNNIDLINQNYDFTAKGLIGEINTATIYLEELKNNE